MRSWRCATPNRRCAPHPADGRRCAPVMSPRRRADARRHAAACVANSGAPRRRTLKTSAFVTGNAPRARRPHAGRRLPTSRRVPRAGDSGVSPLENFHGRVLTVEKTALRFRPNKRWPRKRVSRSHAKTRSTIPTSALDCTGGAGRVSLRNPHMATTTTTREASRRGFFHAGTAAGHPRIRSGARCAPAVGRGSDTRGGVTTGQ